LTINGGQHGFVVDGSNTSITNALTIHKLSITDTDFNNQQKSGITLGLNTHQTSNVNELVIDGVDVKISSSGSKAISLFGFDGTAVINDVVINSGTATLAAPIGRGLEIQGSSSGDIKLGDSATQNPGFPDLNDVVVTNVTMTGYFQVPLSVGMYATVDGLTLGTAAHGIDLSGATATWGSQVSMSYIKDATIDASQWNVVGGAGQARATFSISAESGNQGSVDSNIMGTAGNDMLLGGSGTGFSLSDVRNSQGSGNDTLMGGAGNDYLNGGIGTDVSIVTSPPSFGRVPSGSTFAGKLTVTTADGTDILDGIEVVQ